jgi:hypothetical protein
MSIAVPRQTSIWFADSPRETPSGHHRSNSAQANDTDERTRFEETDEDDSEDIIMAVDQKGQKIGCAYYNVADEVLCFMEDVELPGSDCIDAR